MIAADLCRALLLFSVPISAIMGWLHIEQLYLIALLLSIGTLCFTVAQRSFLPSILSEEQLVEGNSKLSASTAMAEVCGPAFAGLLIQLISAPFTLIIDACSFLFSALCLLLIREQVSASPVQPTHQSFLNDFRAGLHLLLTQPVLRVLALGAMIRNFFGGAFATLYTLYVVRELHVSAPGYGLLVSLGGVGALSGAFLARYVLSHWGLARTLLASILIDALMSLFTPLASGPLAFFCLAISQFIGDSCFIIHEINELSLRQSLVPEQMQGRLHSCMYVLVNGVGPIGALLAGWLSLEIGIRPVLWLGSSGMLIAAVCLLFSPLRRL
jgi:predicted MFS family arabinose efflux permease